MMTYPAHLVPEALRLDPPAPGAEDASFDLWTACVGIELLVDKTEDSQ